MMLKLSLVPVLDTLGLVEALDDDLFLSTGSIEYLCSAIFLTVVKDGKSVPSFSSPNLSV